VRFVGLCYTIFGQPSHFVWGKYLLHDHTFQLGCPDVLSLVGDPLSEKRMWFTESHIVSVDMYMSKAALFRMTLAVSRAVPHFS
jgi:hypothetical protein